MDFLLELLPSLRSDEQSSPEIAYFIAGMLASSFARTLSEDDPLMEIMIIAGELEVSPNNAAELTKELVRKIEAFSR